jgi:beta-lactamase regulating signal transducer with metallopeptidase domain
MMPLQFLVNHLWQSTVFAAVAGLLALALRNNLAQVRYWLWLAASVKFLIPFAILVDVDSHFGWHPESAISTTPSVFPSIIEQVSQPFAAPVLLLTTPIAGPPSSASLVPAILCAVWAIGFVTLVFSWWLRWRSLRAALRTASPLHLPIGMEVMTSPAFAEPGVFGIRRPVLLLPAGITSQLTPPQLEAILAHELCHVRRRDNLTTAIHMAVEAVFWFYPLVWWLGARLMEERERACDEEVLQLGNEPEAYAEGILKICELYLESPLPCVSGVTGANLKKRIETIMSNRIALRLNLAKKVVLVGLLATAVAAPVIVGMLDAPAVRAQSAGVRPRRNSRWFPSSPARPRTRTILLVSREEEETEA